MLLASCLLTVQAAWAQVGQRIVEIRIEQEGRPVTEPLITGLIETRVGEPLSMRAVRETITHLMSLNRFEDVQPNAEPADGGVRLRYVLFPLHAVDRVEFRGTLGVSDGDLRRVIAERFGPVPSAGRAPEVARVVTQFYKDRGYPNANVASRIEELHDPDRATMVLDVDAGPRSRIVKVEFEQIDQADKTVFLAAPAVREGQPFDAEAIAREIERYQNALRARGYYEARATSATAFTPDGMAVVAVSVERGPRVSIAFSGDPLPEADRERLVPIRTEASVDQDLLEDATFAIRDYLYARGYRDATADVTRDPKGDELTINFVVKRGRRHVVDSVVIAGNMIISEAEIRQVLRLEPGQPFVAATLEQDAAALRNIYRARGFTRATVDPASADLPGGENPRPDEDRRVEVRVTIVEGPRTLAGDVTFQGNTVLSEAQLRALLTSAPGRPFSAVEVATDRDRIDLEYRNRGYESVVVSPALTLAENDTRANIRFDISEGPQVLVDHVIIVGNDRTSTETIERELLLKPGAPLGYSARIESQQRLAALGLFRRVRIEELRHAGEPRRDVLVQVEEAPPTTIGYGGGVEGGTRLRTGDDLQAEEQFEFAPRGFFEIGRRNMWGKNRSVNLFTRVSLRARDSGFDEIVDERYGFNEYRVVATYREPRVFNTGADAQLTGILDQSIRSSFNFIRRQVRGETGLRLSPRYSVTGFYSLENTELFDEKFTDDEKPVIDRVFPQVRLSKFSGSLIRDSRTDIADPAGGSLIVTTGDLAARAIGSEVGFVRSYMQAFSYHRLPGARRVVLALGARFGAAQGFHREVVGDDGVVQIVDDLPASERFFAGGDTTVRGFSLDRLGTSDTISQSGFPTGGNGLIIFNAELRIGVLSAVDAVTFVDAGNVFKRASDLDVTDLRPAAGFGIHYRSPIGPVRVELGFNLDRRELVPGQLERLIVPHVSLGRAF